MMTKSDLSSYFYIYPSFKLTKGCTKSILLDTQTAVLSEMPNELYEILISSNKKFKILDIIEKYGIENRAILTEYFQWLIEKDAIFLSVDKSDFENFKEINETWDSPFEITNGIIDINELSKNYTFERITKFVNLRIPHIELRFFCNLKIDYLDKALAQTLGSEINSIIIYLPYHRDNSIDTINKLVNKHLRISSFYIYNSPIEKKQELHNGQSQVIYLKKDLGDIKNCGIVAQNYFVSNASFQRESKLYNSCLNRKISIDVNGEIKNCPSMQQSYGNIKDTTLEEALNKQGFKDVWNIKKDDVKICQDCEYRYICQDCRAYIENPDDMYSKPLKCGYNPYTGIWEDWSSNPLKQKVIEFYGMRELIQLENK